MSPTASLSIITTTLALVAVLAMGCDSSHRSASAAVAPAPVTVSAVDTEPVAAVYSPFVVKIEGESAPFQTISFKDVGIADVDEGRSVELYEIVAESLRYELESSDRHLSSEVLYDEGIADPSNHTACGGKHIYVDIWRAPSSSRWGYSLWSGCSEAHKFAWREVSVAPNMSEEGAVDHLTSRIGEDLRAAIKTGCFTKAC